jgi:hypothetical protein
MLKVNLLVKIFLHLFGKALSFYYALIPDMVACSKSSQAVRNGQLPAKPDLEKLKKRKVSAFLSMCTI